jgi:hypothetical protein
VAISLPISPILQRPLENAFSLIRQTQSTGFFSTSRVRASQLPATGSLHPLYSHRAVNGNDINTLSIRTPGVTRPNFVPRSWTRLNSTYLHITLNRADQLPATTKLLPLLLERGVGKVHAFSHDGRVLLDHGLTAVLNKGKQSVF